ncbi:MAG: hypothetical protein JXR70_07890 [Spirochaetales bacterium]|nr:hypothetical protein [Spirochaetales bacterium]
MEKVKYVLVKGKAGLGNRMLSSLTGIAYSLLTGRTLIVDWNDGMYADPNINAFPYFFNLKGVNFQSEIPDYSSIAPLVWKNNLSKSANAMVNEFANNKHTSFTVLKKFSINPSITGYNEDIVVLFSYTHQLLHMKKALKKSVYFNNCNGLKQIIKLLLSDYLVLNESIINDIRDFKEKNKFSNILGIHIRYTDRKVPLQKIINKAKLLLAKHKFAKIFLATDNEIVIQKFKDTFPQIIQKDKWFPTSKETMHSNNACPDKIKNGVDALIDMYLLAECDALIYPGRSTFSVISSILSKAPKKLIIDIDKYNIKVNLVKFLREHLS